MNTKEEQLYDYISANTTPLEDILDDLERKTHLLTTRPRMMSGKVQGATLRSLTRIIKPMRAVEIGTFTGYSALTIAAAMPDNSILYTIDINDETAYIAEEAFAASKYGERIEQRIGSALDVIPALGGVFDMVFMDGNKREYVEYYNMLMDGGYLASGSVILADNVLWDGKILDLEAKDSQTQTIIAFNKMVATDPRVEATILPLRDGLSIITVL